MPESSCIGAVILAAGSSSRMGTPKQTLQFEGTSLLRRAALAALEAGCSPVVVVTGANVEGSRAELEGLPVREVWNRHWERGMGSSIREGLQAMGEAEVDAAILMVCDQPHATADVISTLMTAYREVGRPVVASMYGGSFGVPALFSRTIFPDLAQLEGGGAKQVIKKHALEAHFVPFPEGEKDVDTPEDLKRLTSGSKG